MFDRVKNKIPEPDDLDLLLGALGSQPIDKTDEPQPEVIAARRAARAGKSVEEILAEDRARLREARYPSSECFEPYEVERYFLDSLRPERVAHKDTCAACAALLEAAMPRDAGVERIVEEVRKTAEELGRVPASQPVHVGWWPSWLPAPQPVFASIQSGPALGFVTDALAAILPFFVVVFGVDFLYRFVWPFPGAPEIARSVLLIAAVALTGIASLVVLKTDLRRVLIRDSVGALTAGIILAVVGGGFVWWNLGQQVRQAQVGVNLVSARLAETVAASFAVRRSAGAFPELQLNEGPLALTTALHTSDRAIYRAETKGLKGTVVAKVDTSGGVLYWDSSGVSKQVGRLIRGRIETVTDDGIVLREQGGEAVRIKAPMDPNRRPGQEVVAIVDERTNVATGVYPVARAMPILPTP